MQSIPGRALERAEQCSVHRAHGKIRRMAENLYERREPLCSAFQAEPWNEQSSVQCIEHMAEFGEWQKIYTRGGSLYAVHSRQSLGTSRAVFSASSTWQNSENGRKSLREAGALCRAFQAEPWNEQSSFQCIEHMAECGEWQKIFRRGGSLYAVHSRQSLGTSGAVFSASST